MAFAEKLRHVAAETEKNIEDLITEMKRSGLMHEAKLREELWKLIVKHNALLKEYYLGNK